MAQIKKRLIVMGDRVLIRPDEGEDRTEVGLYLPKWAVERETIQAGKIVSTGPGIPLPSPQELDGEPWRQKRTDPSYLPMQAKEGDYAIFLRKSAIEIRYEEQNYLVVPQAAILVIIRDEYQIDVDDLDNLDEEDEKTDDNF